MACGVRPADHLPAFAAGGTTKRLYRSDTAYCLWPDCLHARICVGTDTAGKRPKNDVTVCIDRFRPAMFSAPRSPRCCSARTASEDRLSGLGTVVGIAAGVGAGTTMRFNLTPALCMS